jgi:hypothetical protein
MGPIGINKHNVGRIAERIVSNELEYRGFRVSDLNKEGTSANADLLAARDGKTWQIQVKGATESYDGTWFGYGHCTDAIIAGDENMFNRSTSSFYKAEIVVLVSVKTAKDYHFLVLPVEIAERAAQINLDYAYRTPKKDGGRKKPSIVWVSFYIPPRMDASKKAQLETEQELLKPYLDNWDVLEARL